MPVILWLPALAAVRGLVILLVQIITAVEEHLFLEAHSLRYLTVEAWMHLSVSVVIGKMNVSVALAQAVMPATAEAAPYCLPRLSTAAVVRAPYLQTALPSRHVKVVTIGTCGSKISTVTLLRSREARQSRQEGVNPAKIARMNLVARLSTGPTFTLVLQIEGRTTSARILRTVLPPTAMFPVQVAPRGRQ